MPERHLFERPVLLAGLAALLLAGCSTVSTTVDYDHNTDFGRYRTYSWRDGHPTNPIADRRIKDAVDRVLSSRGLTRVEGDGEAMTAQGPKMVSHFSGLRDCNAGGTGGGR